MAMEDIPQPVMFLQCVYCVAEQPRGESHSSWARQQVGIGMDGALIAWCQRHNVAVARFAKWPDEEHAPNTRVMCQDPGHDHGGH